MTFSDDTLAQFSSDDQYVQIRLNSLKDLFSTSLGLFAGLRLMQWFVTPTCKNTQSINHVQKLLFLVQHVPADYRMSDVTTDQLWLRMTLMQLADDCSLSLLTKSETCTIMHLQAGPNRPNTCLKLYIAVFFRNTVVKTVRLVWQPANQIWLWF